MFKLMWLLVFVMVCCKLLHGFVKITSPANARQWRSFSGKRTMKSPLNPHFAKMAKGNANARNVRDIAAGDPMSNEEVSMLQRLVESLPEEDQGIQYRAAAAPVHLLAGADSTVEPESVQQEIEANVGSMGSPVLVKRGRGPAKQQKQQQQKKKQKRRGGVRRGAEADTVVDMDDDTSVSMARLREGESDGYVDPLRDRVRGGEAADLEATDAELAQLDLLGDDLPGLELGLKRMRPGRIGSRVAASSSAASSSAARHPSAGAGEVNEVDNEEGASGRSMLKFDSGEDGDCEGIEEVDVVHAAAAEAFSTSKPGSGRRRSSSKARLAELLQSGEAVAVDTSYGDDFFVDANGDPDGYSVKERAWLPDVYQGGATGPLTPPLSLPASLRLLGKPYTGEELLSPAGSRGQEEQDDAEGAGDIEDLFAAKVEHHLHGHDQPAPCRVKVVAVVTHSSRNGTARECVERIFEHLRRGTEQDPRVDYQTICLAEDQDTPFTELEDSVQMWLEGYNTYHLVDGAAMKEAWGGIVPHVLLSERNLQALLERVQWALLEDGMNGALLTPRLRRLRFRGGAQEMSMGFNTDQLESEFSVVSVR